MRPPQCGLRHLAAAVNATLDLCESMICESPAAFRVSAPEAIKARRAVTELNEHLDGCERCETP